MMTPAVFTKEVIEFLIHSGWRQFFLDEQFKFSPPFPALAELSTIAPDILENTPFLNIFGDTDQKNLDSLLRQLAAGSIQTILATAFLRQSGPKDHEGGGVELILYLTTAENTQSHYIGFIRPLPAAPAQKNIVQPESSSKIEALEGLLEASRALNTLDLQNILNTIVQRVSVLLKSNHTVVYLADYQTQKLNPTATHSSPDMAHVPTPAFNFEKGTVGWVLKHRQPLCINDVTKDDRFLYVSPDSHLIANLISTPLIVKGEAIGVLEATHKSDGVAFTEDDVALLSAFASQAAVAIHHARLFQETNQRLAEVSTLYTLADQLTKVLELDRVIESSVTILKHALDCSSCCLFLKQKTEQAETLALKLCSGWLKTKQNDAKINYITQLANKLIAKPSPIYLQNVNLAEPKQTFNNQEVSKQPPLGSVMIMPLLVKEELLGALVINDQKINAFGQAEGRLLTIAAAQISTAIENARLYDNLEQRATELEAALNEVAATNHLRSEFVENVSHELRTPLTFIKAYIALILENSLGQIPPAVREKLEIISHKTNAVIRLVEDLVSLQRLESGNLRFESIATHTLIVRATAGAIAGAAEYNIKIVLDSAPDLPPVRVDVDRIGQVFDNLVGNALKFSPGGEKINITARQDGDRIKFSVQDYGKGIPANQLDKIFERFYQVADSSSAYGGAGLGLTIVKQIVEAHGGEITVQSKVNQGSTFSFWLPIDQ
ncbi:MAG: GAF domain-containing sensor histidine kinase [Anaerolineae bacterium]|nr:GAF domain-containing sensor histidine kinase [Anaerolineae bacterium]